jgi:GNAT superfamily N-acetyltransferase
VRDASEIRIAWRATIGEGELRILLEDGWGQPSGECDRVTKLEAHSLGWATARDDDGRLVGFVNVAWDGAQHAFLLDTTVARALQRQGVGTQLVAVAIHHARRAGCVWLHVDFEPEHRSFYVDACGFDVTTAGLLDLSDARSARPGSDHGEMPLGAESGGTEGIP